MITFIDCLLLPRAYNTTSPISNVQNYISLQIGISLFKKLPLFQPFPWKISPGQSAEEPGPLRTIDWFNFVYSQQGAWLTSKTRRLMIACETGNSKCPDFNLWIIIQKIWIPELFIKGIINYSVPWEYISIYDTHFIRHMYLFRKSPWKSIKKILSLQS